MTAPVILGIDAAPLIARVASATCGEGDRHQFKRPAHPGACDNCGGTAFIRRADDNAETARGRLRADRAQSAPLITQDDRAGVRTRIDAMGSIAGIRAALARIVGGVTA